MTALLVPPISTEFVSAAEYSAFFNPDVREVLDRQESRQQPDPRNPSKSCDTELFFGFFFDGTRNNYGRSEENRSLDHSNIASLYDCFPGMSVPGVLPRDTDWDYQLQRYTHFFRVYVPGVGSSFREVGDEGKGNAGAAAGAGGTARIAWALVQAINNVHRYFLKAPLIDSIEASRLVHRIVLLRNRLVAMEPASERSGMTQHQDLETRYLLQGLLARLHRAIKPHMHEGAKLRPQKIDPGVVTRINVAIFGFSRGATQARAFANWLVALCRADSRLLRRPQTATLGGFEVAFSFMGLFDTVASVWVANTAGDVPLLGAMDGHAGFADAEVSLRVPPEFKTLHLVAGHEVRRSFPCDSVSVGNTLPPHCSEVVFPGAHSDIGGGYAPKEQGKGQQDDGADMLSRIPLIYMYREARLSGVPLKLELAKPGVKRRFAVTGKTIADCNAYLESCNVKKGTLTQILREQRRLAIQWKLLRRANGAVPLEQTRSFRSAAHFDRHDLHSANLEFEAEIAEYERWLANKGRHFTPREQPAGFLGGYANEWEDIAAWRPTAQAISMAACTLFDDYVHDSRAGCKVLASRVLGAPVDELSRNRERELVLLLESWVGKLTEGANRRRGFAAGDGLTPEQRRAAAAYLQTGQVPLMVNTGREPFTLARAGYLRYRKVYAGADSVLLSDAGEPGVLPQRSIAA